MATTLKEQSIGFQVPKLAQDLIAGTCGGWAQVIVGKMKRLFFFFFFLIVITGHPFDTLKVRLQTQPSPPIYKNAMDCFRQLVQSEGVRNENKSHVFLLTLL